MSVSSNVTAGESVDCGAADNVASNQASRTGPKPDQSSSSETNPYRLRASPNQTLYWVPVCEQRLKPSVGRVFDTIDDAISCYKEYANVCGFLIRNSTKHTVKGAVTVKYILCKRQGEKNRANSNSKRKTTSARCCCNAGVGFSVRKDGKYVVKFFREEHNHKMLSVVAREFAHKQSNFDSIHQRFLMDCADARIGPVKAYQLFERTMGGPQNVTTTVEQFKNAKREIMVYVTDVDVQMVIDRFKKKKDLCSGYYFNYSVDANDKLTRLFWADPISIKNYEVYGDAVAYDSTYKTNRYNLVFAPFTGLNNHNMCVTFAAGLMLKEDIDSYVWMFENFETAMGRPPKVLVTDQDPSMKIAAERVFPNTRHRYCMWHIMAKVSDKIGVSVKDTKGFRAALDSIVWDKNMKLEEFEEKWNLLMADYKTGVNAWLDNLYVIRSSWIEGFYHDVLLGGMIRTTSIAESQNRFFKKYTDRWFSLVELMMQFDSAMDSQRHKQKKKDSEEETRMPDLVTLLDIEKQCAERYTYYAFKKMQKQIKVALYKCRVIKVDESEHTCVFRIRDPMGCEYDVEYDNISNETKCACTMYMRVGLPCCHAFTALKEMNVDKLPANLVHQRWAKKTQLMPNTPSSRQSEKTIERSPEVTNLVTLFYSCIAAIGGNNVQLRELGDILRDYERSISDVSLNRNTRDMRSAVEKHFGVAVPENVSVFQPEQGRNKGSGKRLQSGKEIAIDECNKSKRRCRECKKLVSHDSRNCKKIQAAAAEKKRVLQELASQGK